MMMRDRTDSPVRVAIVSGARTPFAKAGTVLRKHSPLDLAVHAVNGLLSKTQLDSISVDELAYGITVLDPRIPHFAREVVFSSELPSTARALTLTNHCITGTSAITTIYDSIVSDRAEVGIAGGVESMSNPSILFGRHASRVFLEAASAKTLGQRVRILAHLRPTDLKPSFPGVNEPSTGLSMGEHTELMVKEWRISRGDQDEIAYQSHMNAARATEDGRLKAEIHPLDGIDHDRLIRPDTSLEKLAKLPPVFDQSATGTLSAGNSSPLTDGATAILLMSESRARQDGREPLAFVKAFEYAAIDPSEGLLMAPAVAVPRLLRRTGLTLGNVDLIEVHEAFGGQVACNLRAWEQGWKEPAIGTVDRTKLNQLGSSIAVGHPFSATGARIVTTLANEMKRRDVRYGLVSICAAGAQACAMIIERD